MMTKTETGYDIYDGDTLLGSVEKYRDRTPVMSGRILVGHTERSLWMYRYQLNIIQRGFRTRQQAIDALLRRAIQDDPFIGING